MTSCHIFVQLLSMYTSDVGKILQIFIAQWDTNHNGGSDNDERKYTFLYYPGVKLYLGFIEYGP